MLAAFVWAAFLTYSLARLKAEKDTIRSARPADRIDAIQTAAEWIGVDLKDIPEAERGQIVLAQMRHRTSIRKYQLGAIVFVLVVALGVIVVAMLKDSSPPASVAAHGVDCPVEELGTKC